MRRQWFMPVLALAAAASCGESRGNAHAAAGGASNAGGGAVSWTDDEVLAYTRALAQTLASDAATIEKRVRSAALRSFARRVLFQHKELGGSAYGLITYDVKVPSLGEISLKRHEDGMKQLRQQRDFDVRYVAIIRRTLSDAEEFLNDAGAAQRGDGTTALIEHSYGLVRAEASNAQKIEEALLARRTAPPEPTRR